MDGLDILSDQADQADQAPQSRPESVEAVAECIADFLYERQLNVQLEQAEYHKHLNATLGKPSINTSSAQ